MRYDNVSTTVKQMVTASNASGTLGQYAYDGDGKRVKKVVPSTG
ncbi:MAG: hypothetical protein R2682_02325 [Pyrinomonadaceae bacterium]